MKKAEKYDMKSKKVDLTLISANAAEAEARVLMFGDSKYSRRDYLEQPDYDLEAMRALLRHVSEIMKGEQYDQETGQHHLAHIRANAGIILECWAVHGSEPGANWPHVAAGPKLASPPEFTVSYDPAVTIEVDDATGKISNMTLRAEGPSMPETPVFVGPNAFSTEAEGSEAPDPTAVEKVRRADEEMFMVPQGRCCED